MKLTIERKPFVDALVGANRIAPAKAPVPILSNVLLSASASSLELRASDLDIEITETVKADVSQPGAVTVNAKMLLEIVRKMPEGCQIIIEQSDNKPMSVRAGRSRFVLQTLPESDFPILSAGDMKYHFDLEAGVLGRSLEKTSFAASTEETRYYLNGVYLHVEGSNLIAVATDGHRLAKYMVQAPSGAVGMPGIIVPKKTISETQKIVSGNDGEVSISVSDTKIRIKSKNTILTSKLIDGTFPDYQRVIPQGATKIAKVDVDEITAAAERVSTVSSEVKRAIKLAFKDNALSLEHKSDVGEAEESIGCEYEGEPIEIGFNHRYLLDILKAADCDFINLEITDPGSPTIINPVGHPESMFVLMPMRI